MDYFQKHDHRLVESAPVIPFDDPTILFINAGMNQFKDVFTGHRKRDFPRATSSQKCIRAGGKHNDLDNVGFTARHHTFFEMLGNFSFGDYFKEEAIKYCWEWVTDYLKLPKDRLYATVYEEDDEAFELWESIAPELKNGRVMRFGKKDNYWSMGDIGPCGPCSEIHYDRGEKFGRGPDDVVNGETERFVEIWNLVFMQYEQTTDGRLIDLPAPSVDTGAGLERIAAIVQNVDSNYGIDIFQNLIRAISDLTGAKYEDNISSHNVVADHIRALTFAIADGAGVSNEGRGYVLRRILRRAARHGRELGAQEPFLHRLVPVLVDEMGETYPEIREKQDLVTSVIKAEEESFGRTLDDGIARIYTIAVTEIEPEIGRARVYRGPSDRDLAKQQMAILQKLEGNHLAIDGKTAFMLYDTYGFPLDLIQIEAAKYGLEVDTDGFEALMERQQVRSRAASLISVVNVGELIEDLAANGISELAATSFEGKKLELKTTIMACSTKQAPLIGLVLAETPFYAEAGGQISDKGRIIGDEIEIHIEAMHQYQDRYIHEGILVLGTADDLKRGMTVTATVDGERRWDIMRNHTATHLAHAALHKVLGDHARQSGSYVGPDRLRFDFSHHQPMIPEEVAEVERIVNEQILLGLDVRQMEMPVEEAKKKGAMALFGEKYGDMVLTVFIGPEDHEFSKELCGGTHVQNTSQIGPFFITLETGIASGVRRMEAITGREAEKKIEERAEIVRVVTEELACSEADLVTEVQRLLSENGAMQKEGLVLRSALVSGKGLDAVGQLDASPPPLTKSAIADAEVSIAEANDRIGLQLRRKRLFRNVCGILNCTESELVAKARQLGIDHQHMRVELKKLRAQVEADEGKTVGSEDKVGNVHLWTHDFGPTDIDTLKAWTDEHKQAAFPTLAVGFGEVAGTPTLIVGASAAGISDANLHSGSFTKDLTTSFGGQGGGKPSFGRGGFPLGVASEDVFGKAFELLSASEDSEQ